MRLGGPVYGSVSTPEEWRDAVARAGYRAAYCPVANTASDAEIEAYAEMARQADIVIAETGAWSNPMHADPVKRREALAYCQAQLALAERIGACCCVNIVGSRGAVWDGPDAGNYSGETFDWIVETTRAIIDAVKPTRTFYTLETMPWMLPDSVDSYARLLRAIDRPQFGVHFDPANLVCSPALYYQNGDLIRDFCARLGPHIKSCHVKDIALDPRFMVHLDEVRPGLGSLDMATLLRELHALDADLPLMLEHLPAEADYALAADYVRGVAREAGVPLEKTNL